MIMFKKMIKNILIKFRTRKKQLTITSDCNIELKLIENIGIGSKIQDGVSCFGSVKIGRFTSINGPATQIASKINSITIGNFCSIASGVVIQEYYHQYNRVTSYYINRNIFGKDLSCDIYSKGNIVIEDDVWVGANSVILSGVTIGSGSVIGAGSIVTKDIPKYSIVGGNPAKVIKSRFKKETIGYLENIQWWKWNESKLIKNKELFTLREENIKNYEVK